jgi:hypothetical protein
MAVAHEELTGKTWLFTTIAEAVGSRTASLFGPPPSQPGCARPERRPATVSRRIPAPRLCALLAERPDAPARTETRQAAAIRQVRAKICENYLIGHRARSAKFRRAGIEKMPAGLAKIRSR